MKPSTEHDGTVLVVDDDAVFRGAVVEQLKRVGIAVRAVESYESGLEAAQGDPSVRVVLLDHPTVGARVDLMVDALRAIRPDALIIGNSGADRRLEFAAAGVAQYLQKPWRMPEFLSLLRRRIGVCVECGRPLPLRLPGPDETGQRWVCATCGARYCALLDEEAPRYQHRYVLWVDDQGGLRAPTSADLDNPSPRADDR